MELIIKETADIQAVEVAQDQQALELNDLQLSIVGGGVGEVIVG